MRRRIRQAALRAFVISMWACLAGFSVSQDRSLTLADAVAMARQKNGAVRSAYLGLEAARSRVRQSAAEFLPTVTPAFLYSNTRAETFTGAFRGVLDREDHVASVTANWRLLDSGQRDWSYRATRRLVSAEENNARETLRSVLFTVQQQFFDALRAQELLRVADAQVVRARELLDMTLLQIEVGAAPKKDRLQAEADYLNALVSRLQAENFKSTTLAQLKATIGWDDPAAVLSLQPVEEPDAFAQPDPLEALIREGFESRPDLRDLRFRVEARRFDVMIADRNASFTWSLDARYDRAFSPDVSDERQLRFLLTFPLFDGGFSREGARQARLSLESLQNTLLQSERQARSEIESAYTVLVQDVQRVQAAKAALEAARLNYRAASESFEQGAEGTSIIAVLTAQVSLVTAELNYVEAIYDYFISEARLDLAVGRPLFGENSRP